MWYSENLGTFSRAKTFNYDGVTYPASAFKNPEVLASATIYPLVVESVDTEYYKPGAMTRTFEDDVWVERYEAIPKEFEEVQREKVKKTVNEMDARLTNTDRFLVRAEEMDLYAGTFLTLVSRWRVAVYEAYNFKLREINKAVTVKELQEAEEKTIEIPEEPDFPALYLEKPLLK